MKKMDSFLKIGLLVSLLLFSLLGCMDSAMAPKEEPKPAAESTAAPTAEPAPAPTAPAAK